MSARDLWPPRRALQAADALDCEAALAEAPASFPADDKLVEAFEAGKREERTRIATICRLPIAAGDFPRLALIIALAGVSLEQACEALRAAETDARARSQPTESFPLESATRGRAATIH
jgi:hypothetical protein